MPAKPTSIADLQKLLSQYGGVLSAENTQFITELIEKLQSGGDRSALVDLAARMQKAADQKQNNS